MMVASFIAIHMFIACCIATKDQLQSMFGIIACTVAVVFVGALFPKPGNRLDGARDLIFYASIGCAIGILWSEHFYSVKTREQASVKEEKYSQKDNGHAELTAEDNSIEP
jgi:RsiW-degrading membrane proteinase PrsW (M82 family)